MKWSPVAVSFFLVLLILWPVSFVRGVAAEISGPPGFLLGGMWDAALEIRFYRQFKAKRWFIKGHLLRPASPAFKRQEGREDSRAVWSPSFGFEEFGGVKLTVPFWCFLFAWICWILYRALSMPPLPCNPSTE